MVSTLDYCNVGFDFSSGGVAFGELIMVFVLAAEHELFKDFGCLSSGYSSLFALFEFFYLRVNFLM